MSINADRTLAQRGQDRVKYLNSLIQSSENKKQFNQFQKQKNQEVLLSNAVTVESLITPENLLVTDDKTQKSTSTVIDLTKEADKLLINLEKIAEKKKAKIILDNVEPLLTDEQMKLANTLFTGIVNKAKKQFSKGVEPDMFADFMVNYLLEYDKNELVSKDPIITVKKEAVKVRKSARIAKINDDARIKAEEDARMQAKRDQVSIYMAQKEKKIEKIKAKKTKVMEILKNK